MEVVKITEYSPKVLSALNRLLPQLSDSARRVSEEDLRTILASGASHLYMAMESETFLGALTLVIFDIPTGRRARIEDVVVDSQARDQGIGQKLIAHAVQAASGFGARSIDLTSNSGRTAANALYLKMGFEQKQTNAYRMFL
ncbi:MAG: GNAT family N-acetyltransferase [Desulfobacteraceae bacterium]|nr:GNAT family N-acetyltransferase [Desulfobacteraceae bacterium]